MVIIIITIVSLIAVVAVVVTIISFVKYKRARPRTKQPKQETVNQSYSQEYYEPNWVVWYHFLNKFKERNRVLARFLCDLHSEDRKNNSIWYLKKLGLNQALKISLMSEIFTNSCENSPLTSGFSLENLRFFKWPSW